MNNQGPRTFGISGAAFPTRVFYSHCKGSTTLQSLFKRMTLELPFRYLAKIYISTYTMFRCLERYIYIYLYKFTLFFRICILTPILLPSLSDDPGSGAAQLQNRNADQLGELHDSLP